ncbi:MAG TPA: DEAD/DEAH box helicase [Gammaproteobacteria bacterium]|nr:DEAD/DEAH box helicase [Gammaproteobacteria bacterium]
MNAIALDGPNGFAQLGLGPKLLAVLSDLGYEEPTAIQRQAIPPLLEGRDVIGQAATGTGKTAAFALPLLERLTDAARRTAPMGLILVPTRELAIQVAEALYRYGRGVDARVLPVYGGQPIGRQLAALRRGVDVVIATPGRALDHIRRRALDLTGLEVVVLDEADEMLDMGFAEDIDAIFAEVPDERQTLLFSATLPARIAAIAKRHLRDPVKITIAREAAARGSVPKVRQTAYLVPRAHKAAALGRILDMESPAAAIVFCGTRVEVDELTPGLAARGYGAEALHGGMTQDQRDRVMGRLRSGTIELLVATDVAARGLDIEQLTHVVNYDVPSAPDAYVHRIGRVGRAGREGVAITLCEPRQHGLLRNIERVTKQRIRVDQLPTVADLTARRLDLTRAALRESLLEGKLDHYRVVVEGLADEFDVMEVALAAVKLADEQSRRAIDEREIPQAKPAPERGAREGRRTGRNERAAHTEGRPRRERRDGPGMTRVFINAGREAGIRPQDLVGAIANEARIDAREIGAIEIADRFSLVEVAEDVADDVIRLLRGSAVRGRKVNVRRERYER